MEVLDLFAQMEFELGPADEEFLESDEYQDLVRLRLQFINNGIRRRINSERIHAIYYQRLSTAMMDNGVLSRLFGIESMKVKLSLMGKHIHAVDSQSQLHLSFVLRKDLRQLHAKGAKPSAYLSQL